MTIETGDIVRRRLVYALLITVAVGGIAGRILSIRSNPAPTFGGNDRSRWATVRALVDEGTYAIGRRDPALVAEKNKYGDIGIMEEDGWQTIDKVLIPETQTFYSSKPPLLPTLLAGEYWLLKHALGWSITESPGLVIRTILFTVNWLPLVFYWICLGRLLDDLGTTEWGRLYVMSAGCFATFLTPFSISLNNHTIASWSALFAVYFCVRALTHVGSGRNLAWAGLLTGFAACNELPAASLLTAIFIVLIVIRPGPTFAFFLPAALLPIGGLLLTNYLALGRLSLAYADIGGDLYEYPGSHWLEESGKTGIDWAWMKEGRFEYALHLLVGHHGLFSLTPIFLLSMVGIAVALFSRSLGGESSNTPRVFAALTLTIAVVVVGFYLFVTPPRTHNYGGWTSGPRQLMWLTPLFLLTMLPCADWLAARRPGRILGYVLLGLSVLSISYALGNPWRHPWIYDFMNWQGWIRY